MTDISIGDRVVCVISGVVGTVTKKYRPTASEPQIMVRTYDGRLYHAPEKEWRKWTYNDERYISELEKNWVRRLFPDPWMFEEIRKMRKHDSNRNRF